ncbi:MAG: DUF1826 domain-containing protein [Acetobacter sp.]|nr:DUF1826 domain-containing protein [Acetobacter sp.]
MFSCTTRNHLEQISAFRSILSPHRSLVFHPQKISSPLLQAANTYLSEGPSLLVVRGSLSEIKEQLEANCPTPARLLISDVLDLAKMYSDISGHQNLRIRLEKITTDSCRKFHVDCIDLRLLRTYVGPGVQWTTDNGCSVHEAPAGAVVFLKGKHFPGWESAETILHRSPPLSSRPSEERIRLLLTIDDSSACLDGGFDMVA